jgi:hypothetical protein
MSQPINNPLQIELCNGSTYYLPALGGDLPHGKDMAPAARAYIADMTADGGPELAACHVSIWAEFAAALAIAAAETLPRK